MKKKDDEEIEKQNISTLKTTDKIISNMSKQKMNRHVKEENEPVFDDIINDFQMQYAKQVAGKSSMEILKFAKNEL